MRRVLSVVAVGLLVVVLAGCNLLDWPQYGANGANNGSAGLSPLSTHTVGNLHQRWVAPSANVAPASLAVVGGTVYASSALNQAIANGTFTSPPPPLEAHSVTDGSLRWSAGGETLTSTNGGFCVNATFGTVPVVSNGRYDYLAGSGGCLFNGNGLQGCTGVTGSLDATTGGDLTNINPPAGLTCLDSDPVAATEGTVYYATAPFDLGSGCQAPNGCGPVVVGSDGSVFIAPNTTDLEGASLSTPAVAGNSLFVVAEDRSDNIQLVAFDRTTHQVLWSQALGHLAGPLPTPSVAHDRVFVATEKLFILAGVNTAQAFDATTGQPLWTTTTALPDIPTAKAPAATGSAVFVRTGHDGLAALDAASGATLWQASLGTLRADDPTKLGPPSVANDVVFVSTEDGRLLAFDATGKTCATATACAPIWSATLSGDTSNSRPVISGDAVYISAESFTTPGGPSTGSMLYKFSLSRQ